MKHSASARQGQVFDEEYVEDLHSIFEELTGLGTLADVALAAGIALEVLVYCGTNGKTAPMWAAEAAARALQAYTDLQIEDLGEAFGKLSHKRMAAQKVDRLRVMIAWKVEKLRVQGVLLNDSKSEKGAFTLVGEEFNISAAQVKLKRQEWETFCKGLGEEPYANISDLPSHADAGKVIANVMAKALAKNPGND